MKPERKKKRPFPVRRLIPNALTLLGLCLGLTSVRLGLSGQFQLAVMAIIATAVLDGIDGRIARLLKAESPIGAQLDSLADFFNFGVAPVFLVYLWGLQSTGRFGWAVLLGFSVCCALRLARFNVDIEDPDRPAWMRKFFTGVPSPAAGALVMLPLYLHFAALMDLRTSPFFIVIMVVTVAGLMVSRLPTYSGKNMASNIPRDWVLPLMLGVGFTAAIFFTFPWACLAACCIIYLLSFPFSLRSYRAHKR